MLQSVDTRFTVRVHRTDGGGGGGRRGWGWVDVGGLSEETLESVRLREENELLMDGLVRSKLEMAETQSECLSAQDFYAAAADMTASRMHLRQQSKAVSKPCTGHLCWSRECVSLTCTFLIGDVGGSKLVCSPLKRNISAFEQPPDSSAPPVAQATM